MVSCGLPLNGAQIKVQRTDGSLADECEVGEIFFNSPMSQLGQVTNEGFSPALADTWIATGDLGVMNESELYLVGREKAVIIRGGRNINAEEIEEACRSLTLEGLRECLALGIYSESLSTENIVLLLEVMVDTQEFERKYPLDWIIAQVNQMTGEAIYDVKVLPSGALKRTTSGKLMRQYKV